MNVFERGDGRQLAFEEFVTSDVGEAAHAVLLFHGAPGSRLFVPGTVPADARLVTFDRPGYGASDPQLGRTLADTARDAEALLDLLDIERVALIGWSGGGPFAAATAHLLGATRVDALALVSAPGPLDEVPGGWEALGDYQRPTAEMARRDPSRSARAIARHMEPFIAQPSSFLGSGRGADGQLLDDPAVRSMLEIQITAALRQGVAGIAADLVAMWLPWGFALHDIVVPTAVFHGSLDSYNAADSRAYAAQIGSATLTEWDACGHLGIVPHWGEVLAAIGAGHHPGR